MLCKPTPGRAGTKAKLKITEEIKKKIMKKFPYEFSDDFQSIKVDKTRDIVMHFVLVTTCSSIEVPAYRRGINAGR